MEIDNDEGTYVNNEDRPITLLFDFPRFMGNPNQNFIAFNKYDFETYIRKYCNFCNLYISVYAFDDLGDKHTARIDKVFFDFDDKTEVIDEKTLEKMPKSLYDVRKLHAKLMLDDILHLINISGGGFHLFIFVEQTHLNNKADTIFNVQNYYEKELDLNLDPKIKGDIRRIFRIPNTYNFNKNRMCVNINDEETLNKTFEEICEYATQPKPIKFFGSKLLDIKSFDKQRDYSRSGINFNAVPKHEIDDYSGALKEIYNNSPDCVKFLIDKKHLDNRERYFLMLYLKETPYKERLLCFDNILTLLKEILSPEKWEHFTNSESIKPLLSIMEKNYYIPTCSKVRFEIKCCPHPNGCGRKHPRYN